MASMMVPGRAPAMADKENMDCVKYAQDSYEFLKDQLQEIHVRTNEYWRYYRSIFDDRRDPVTEKWRAHIVVPQPFFNTEAWVAQQLEILMSADPMIQSDAVFESGQDQDLQITKLLDYTLRINQTRKLLASALRGVRVQGTEFLKHVWKRRVVKVPARPNLEQIEAFESLLNDAVANYGLPPAPDWQSNPAEFESWRALVNKAQRLPQPISGPPDLDGEMEMVQHWGPYIERIPLWQIFLDPLVPEMCDQPIIIHEMFKPAAWVRSLAGVEAKKPYDPKMVEEAMGNWDSSDASQRQTDIANDLGIPAGVGRNPHFQHAVKIWEVYRMNSEFPFQVILNEKRVINKNPRKMPFEHGFPPITPIRNVFVPGFLYGMSAFEPDKALILEQNVLRSLRMDAVTLHTLPVWKHLTGVSLPDLAKVLKPGGGVPVNNMDNIRPLFENPIDQAAYQEVPHLGLDIDRSDGIGDNVRGASAQVGRVSATESTTRLTQALTRLKMHAIQVEDDLTPAVAQWLGLWAQFGTSENRPGGIDPLQGLTRERLISELAMNYRFRGATQAVNRELNAQQLITFFKEFKAVLTPSEQRALAKEVTLVLGLRKASQIVSPEGTAQFEQMAAAQQQAQQQQQAAATQQTQAQQVAAGLPDQMPIGQEGAQ